MDHVRCPWVAMAAWVVFSLPVARPADAAGETADQPWFRRSLVGMEVGPTGAQFGHSDPNDARYCSQFSGREIVRRCVAAHCDYLVIWARDVQCTGFVPSLECYTYVQTHEEFGEPWLKDWRQVPFGFGWLAEGASPYRELPVRAARIACREYSANPDLSDDALHAALGRELFGRHWQAAQVEDTLELCRVFGTDRDWSVPAPLTTLGLVESRRKVGRLDAKKLAFLREQLGRVHQIAARHRTATTPGGRELTRIAQWLGDQWQGANAAILDTRP